MRPRIHTVDIYKPKSLSLLLWALLLPQIAFAAEGGYSNYIPGTYGDFAMAVEPPDQVTLRNDIYYYKADDGESVRAGRIDLDAELTFLVNLTTVLYKPDVKIAGAQYAFGALIPIMKNEIESSVTIAPGDLNTTSRDSSDASGLGDIVLVPWVLYWSGVYTYVSWSQFIVAPTGDYDETNLINTSLNYWSFDTNVALTYLNPSTGWELSANLGYIYNTENSDTDYQSGEEIHLDFAVNRYLSKSFAVGIHGFHLEQISGDSGDGALLGNFEAEASGIGPALLWSSEVAGRQVSVIGKWLHEFNADRRIEGDHVMIGFVVGLD